MLFTVVTSTHCGVYEIFVSRFFHKFSVKTNSLVKSFTVKLISRNNFQVIQKFRKLHTVRLNAQCGFYEIFAKKSVRENFYNFNITVPLCGKSRNSLPCKFFSVKSIYSKVL